MRPLTTIEVAELLEIDYETVLKAVKRGKLLPVNKATRHGGQGWLFDLEDVVQHRPKEDTTYYTNKSAYKLLRQAGCAPYYTSFKSASQFMRRLVQDRKIKAVKSSISGYYLFGENELKRYISRNGGTFAPLTKNL